MTRISENVASLHMPEFSTYTILCARDLNHWFLLFSNHYKMQHYNVSQTLTCRLPASESTNMFVLMQIPGLTTGHLHQKIWHHFHQAPSLCFWLSSDNSDFLASLKPLWATDLKEETTFSFSEIHFGPSGPSANLWILHLSAHFPVFKNQMWNF